MNIQMKIQKLIEIKEKIKTVSYSNKDKLEGEQIRLTRFIEKGLIPQNSF